jgi:predicted SAM-dependent methyltransferase
MGEAQRWQYHGTDHFRAERDKFLQSRSSREDVVRLHLGCGDKILRGYRNIDSFGNPDEYGDITKLQYRNIEEILAVHVFEHFFPWKVAEILKGWRECLKDGGKLILEMPDLKKILKHFQAEEISLTLTMFALYGGEKSERLEDLHKWAWTYETIKPVLEEAGFKDVVEKPALYHWPTRDFRVEATK